MTFLGDGYLEAAVESMLLLLPRLRADAADHADGSYMVRSWSDGGEVSLVGWGLVALAVLMDLGVLRGGRENGAGARSAGYTGVWTFGRTLLNPTLS